MDAASLARILIVDDEAPLMHALCDTLQTRGYRTAGFTSAKAALEALQTESFDLLLTDLSMPEMDGVALLAAALRIDPHLVGIMMTGQGTIRTAVEAMQAGALDYILKPFKISEILPVLSRAVSVRRLRLENFELRNTVAIHELNLTIAHTLDLAVLLDKIVDAALAQLDGDEASLMLVSDDGQSLYVAAARGDFRQNLLGSRLPMGSNIAGFVAAQREPLVFDGRVEHDPPRLPQFPRDDIRSAVSMPIVTRGAVLGVLNVSSTRRQRAFSLGELKGLSLFTGAAGTAVEAARLYDEQCRSNMRYRKLLEQFERAQRLAHMGTDARDLRTGEREWSNETYRIYGVARESFVASYDNVLALVHPDDRHHVLIARELVAKGIRPDPMDYRIVRPDGEVRYIHREWEIVRDEAGEPIEALGSIHDVTEQRAAEKRLRETMENLQRAQRIANMGSLVLDITTDHATWSDEMYRIFGVEPTAFDVATENFIKLIVPEDMEKFFKVRQQVAQGICPEPFEYRIRRPDGELRHIYRETELFYDEAGNAIRLIGTMHDVTEQRAAEAKQRELEHQLRQAQKMEAIGNLTGGMAHDFNNILGVIVGNLDLARDHVVDDEELGELIGEALAAAWNGADLTRRLLAFARRQPLRPKRVDINELVDNTTKLLRRLLGEQIEISLALDGGIWPATIDPAQLEASIANLATNARDAMPQGGRLTIRTANRQLDADYANLLPDVIPGDFAMIEVSDTGVGMPPEILQQIFEPFFTTKEPGKGTGLGLSMVFGFLRQSGGHVNVCSEPGIGTTFRLYLPRTQVEQEAAEMSDVRPLVPGAGETLLVVEDNSGVRRVVTRQLQELGYRVVESDRAAQALAVLEDEPIDLLFSDVVMPGGIDGVELARLALARRPSLKILLTSGFPHPRGDGNAHLPAELALLSKPYSRQELAAALRATLDK
jgi:PAS domain S-box-containing protein